MVSAAARGAFLPGDRLVEAEIARELGISRVPVREALRLLESQGIVFSTPYRGMRLMQVTNRGVAELMRVRTTLEVLAIREIVAAGPLTEATVAPARAAARSYESVASGADRADIVAADEAFHGALCRISGNAVLHGIWQGLARQLSVVWGLGQDVRPKARSAAEHAALMERLLAGDGVGAERQLSIHLSWFDEMDFEAEIAQRRAVRTRG